MKVLVACERSGRVRDALLRHGHDAISCDIEPTDTPGPHIQGRAEELLDDDWDMVVAFPPCTYLSNVSSCNTDDCHHQAHQTDEYRRWRAWMTLDALALFRRFLDCGHPRIAVENPLPHNRAAPLMGEHTASTEPYQFGDPWTKRTYWWLRGLAPLTPTSVVAPTHAWVDAQRPGGRAGREPLPAAAVGRSGRSLTPLGLAEAIAVQWGDPAPQTLF